MSASSRASAMTRRWPQQVDEPQPRRAVADWSHEGATLRTGERIVYMIVDLDTAMPVGGPYTDVEHSRDAWHFLVAPGVKLSHLQLIVRDRQDLVRQVRTWRDGFLLERQERQASRVGSARGCCG